MPPVRKLQIDGQECKNQHDLVMAVLLAAAITVTDYGDSLLNGPITVTPITVTVY